MRIYRKKIRFGNKNNFLLTNQLLTRYNRPVYAEGGGGEVVPSIVKMMVNPRLYVKSDSMYNSFCKDKLSMSHGFTKWVSVNVLYL